MVCLHNLFRFISGTNYLPFSALLVVLIIFTGFMVCLHNLFRIFDLPVRNDHLLLPLIISVKRDLLLYCQKRPISVKRPVAPTNN
jgi:hypothetical protein